MNAKPLVAVLAALLVGCNQPAHAGAANPDDRTALAVAMANYLVQSHTDDVEHRGGVEIGAVAIDGGWALANSRSAERHVVGQLLFKLVCGHWVMRVEQIGIGMEAEDLESAGVSKATAAKLLDDFAKSLQKGYDYLPAQKPASPIPSPYC